MMATGAVLLATGYFSRSVGQSLGGTGLIIFVIGMSMARRDADGFGAGVFAGLVVGLFLFAFLLVLAAVAYGVIGLLHGFDPANAVRLLHATAVLTVVTLVLNLPATIQSADDR